MAVIADAGAETVYTYGNGADTVFAGGGTVGAGRTIASYSWAVLAEPAGSNVTFADTGTKFSTLQNPELVDVLPSLVGDIVSALVIVDDLGESSETNWRKMPASAFKIVAVTSRNRGLRKMSGKQKSWPQLQGPWVDAIDDIDGSVSVGSVEPRKFYIQPFDGDADADGSSIRPFNPLSAAAASVAGPWAQAIAALNALDCSEQPYVGRTIHAMGGTYPEDVSIGGAAPWNIVCHGLVQLGVFGGTTRNFTYQATDAGLTFEGTPVRADLFIGGVGGIDHDICFGVSGDFRLKNAGSYSWLMRLSGVYVHGAAAVLDSFAAGPVVRLRDCRFNTTFNVPNLHIDSANHCVFTGALTAKSVSHAINTRFGGNLTVTSAPTNVTGYDRGFFDCAFAGASAVFSGPAGSALFDEATALRFVLSECTFAGGALAADVLVRPRLRQVDKGTLPSGVPTPGTTGYTFATWTPPDDYVDAWEPIIKVSAAFTLAANGNTKAIALVIFSTALFTYTTAQNAGFLRLVASIRPIGAIGSSALWVDYTISNATGVLVEGSAYAGTFSLDAATFKIDGLSATAAGDVIFHGAEFTAE